jgi:hypothetical protein
MSATSDVRMAPDAVLCLEAPYMDAGPGGPTLIFFKNRKFVCWDVVNETMMPGYPREMDDGWPGVLSAFPECRLRGALHVPVLGRKIYFFYEGRSQAAVWDMDRRQLEAARMDVQKLLPSSLTKRDFTPVYAQFADGRAVLYAFEGFEYTRWTVGSSWPTREDAGFPRRIDADWKDGLVLAPRAGVYVDWPNRSSAHSNRKIYFFMGNLYLRWDVPSNTRNYRLDIVAGWKGWPTFA